MDAETTGIEGTLPGQPLTDLTLRKMRAEALGTMRTEVTILFSDIKGSTSYFESKGDAEGLAMVQHHNSLLFPVIENGGGRVVKVALAADVGAWPAKSVMLSNVTRYWSPKRSIRAGLASTATNGSLFDWDSKAWKSPPVDRSAGRGCPAGSG